MSERPRGKISQMCKTRSAIGRYLFHDPAAAHRKLHVGLNEKLKALGVQVETWRVLDTLSSDEGHTMGELAEIVLMNPSTLTKLIDRMIAHGLVHRKLASEDHRRIQLVLTNAGAGLIGKVRRHVDAQNTVEEPLRGQFVNTMQDATASRTLDEMHKDRVGCPARSPMPSGSTPAPWGSR